MIQSISDEVWAFDCEWVPDIRAGRLILGLPEDCPAEEVLKQMWVAGGATPENPQPFLKTIYCRIVSIAMVIRRRAKDGSVRLFLQALPENPDDSSQDEPYILRRFLNDGVAKHAPQLVGYNSRNADIRILTQRALVNGLPQPELCRRLALKPWESTDIDLMEFVAGFGKSYSVSLNDIARLSGIPGKLDMTGYDVCAAWYRGDRKKIVEYNCFDALTTYLVWVRLCLFCGKFSRTDYDEEQRRVRQLIQDEIEKGQDYLQTFLDAWDELQQKLGGHE
ncbi:MAG: hypothetical protein IJR99_00805 [Kiritimatiellae bacterium]|nr:hypothetical protein [Kiritimatiellia bacterium]